MAATVGLALAGGAVADNHGVGKVLVFTGTAGDPNDSTADAVAAIEAAGAAHDFGVDVTAAAGDINAGNLADYRAVAFVHSSGAVLDPSQAGALEDYVDDGGGFLGIGETANLQPGESFFNTLIGARPSSSSGPSAQDVEFLDRVHPATRDLPDLNPGHEDEWYQWATNPTGSVHTVARARFGSIPTAADFPGQVPAAVTETNILDEGESITDDAVKSGAANNNRPVSWCRDLQHGRSFYTALGRTSDAYTDELEGHLEGAVLWAAGMVRGNCKATITSNFQATRLTPPNTAGQHDIIGEAVDMDISDDGLIFFIGRARCAPDSPVIADWDDPEVGLGCGTIHVWDPGVGGSDDQNPAKVSTVETLEVFGDRGGGSEVAPTGKSETGLTAIAVDREFSSGRPYIYVDWFPWRADEHGPGFRRFDFMGERRLSRFTYDFETKSLVEGSERVIFHYLTQVYACCHTGGSMAFDSEGNLHIPGGDMVGNNPNDAQGGYQNAYPNYTVPAGTQEDPAYGRCTINDHNDNPELCRPGGVISYADARISSGNTATYEGSMVRLRPLPDPGPTPALAPSAPGTEALTPDGEPIPDATPEDWGLGSTYGLPDQGSPNGPNMFALDSPEVEQGLAKPEIYSIGLRNFYSVEIDPLTDLITAASVGPDQNSHSNTWGLEGHSADTILPEAGNYLGWPYCWGNGIGYRKKLPGPAPGIPAPVGTSGTIPGPPYDADGQPTGGWNDCRNPILNDSPFNNGVEAVSAPKPVNFWWGRSNMGCPDYRRDQNLLPFNFVNSERFDRCPWAAKVPAQGGQAGMTGGIYRVPEGANPDAAWPEYWDGRWFLFNYSSPNTTRHAVLLPEDADSSSQAVAVDSLLGIVTPDQIGGSGILGHEFGPDGALYLLNYGGSFFNITNNTALWRYSYLGGPNTPGPDPQAEPTGQANEVRFSIGKSGGVDYEWNLGDGNTSTEPNPIHSYAGGGERTATLTVTYADGERASADVTVDLPQGSPRVVAQGQPKQRKVGPRKKRTKFTFRATNVGDAPTGALRLCASAPKKRLGIGGPRCAGVQNIPVGQTRNRAVKVRIKPKARGKVTRIKLIARGANVTNQRTAVRLRVRRR